MILLLVQLPLLSHAVLVLVVESYLYNGTRMQQLRGGQWTKRAAEKKRAATVSESTNASGST